ncbi:MAG: 2-succinyl-5-enolpyruvyl-6-hydroxy-3-cyclohexene-1-carboxylic-acid synthase [Chitinophagales bacterium]
MTSHLHVQLIIDYLYKRGVQHVVVCPGSRSAPFVIALNSYTSIKKYVIADERSAGYFALGIAQQLRKPVVVICTSGTAVLNLAPAICEAYYQVLPIIAITADRPNEYFDIGDNQTIFQHEIFRNYIEMSLHFEPVKDVDELLQQSAFMDTCFDYRNKYSAYPSHWNVHIPEPLYDIAGEEVPYYELKEVETTIDFCLFSTPQEPILYEWDTAKRIMIISGYEYFTAKELLRLKDITKQQNVVFISEHASNILAHQKAVWNIDGMLAQIAPDQEKYFAPDLVITLGRQILSKKLKQFLRRNKPQRHYHISPPCESWDQFFLGEKSISFYVSYETLLNMVPYSFQADAVFKERWDRLRSRTMLLTKEFLDNTQFSDLKAYEAIFANLPAGTHLQLGNSTPVRYAQFFNLPHNTKVNANRGTSGIDGCLSTAVGAAVVTKKLTVAILGDVSFFYDSNALWNNYLSQQLRIIVINNGGGNIFRLLEGPDSVKDFEDYFETQHQLSAQHLAAMFGLHYYICHSQQQLNETLPEFFQPKKKAAILEIKTNNIVSAAIYKQYFSFLKQQNNNV